MKNDHQRAAVEKKRAYKAPELKSFGSLQRMTQTNVQMMAAIDFVMFSYVQSM